MVSVRPVDHSKSGYREEVGCIVSDECQVVHEGDRADQQVDHRNFRPASDEFRAESTGDSGAVHVEINHGDFVPDDARDRVEPGRRVVESVGEDEKFGQGNRRHIQPAGVLDKPRLETHRTTDVGRDGAYIQEEILSENSR